MKYSIGIIGTGRVGTAIGYALYKKGYSIIGADRNPKKIHLFKKLVGRSDIASNREIAKRLKVIFITTQDSEIIKVYNEILPCLRKNQIIIHCSGALSNSIFKGADKKGIITIGLHPLQTFPTIKQAIGATKNIYYAIEANPPQADKAKALAKRIVKDLKGIPIFIQGKDKPLYHTMCVFASNYLVALMSAVIDIAEVLKIKPKTAFKMLEPLIYQTLKNIKKSGIKKSLSGPIERGDIKTIKFHLTALRQRMPKLIPLYQTLGLKTLMLVSKFYLTH